MSSRHVEASEGGPLTPSGAGDVESVMAAMPHDAVMVVDPDLRLRWVGGPARAELGFPAVGDRLSTGLEQLLAPAIRDALDGRRGRRDIVLGRRVYAVDLTPMSPTGAPGTPSAVLALWADVTAAREEQARLKKSETQLRLTLDNAPIGEALVELDGRWRWVNAALVQLTGYSEAALLGTTFQEITHPDDLALDLDLLQQLLAGDIETYQMEKRYFTASGSIVWVLLCVSLVRDDSNEPLYFVSQILDITDRKAREASLRDLTSMLAHDLRLPTTVIAGYTELLLNDDESLSTEGRRGVVSRLSRAVTSLEDLLSNSLTASALDAHGMMAVPEEIDLNALVRDVVSGIPHPGVSIDIAVSNGATAWADPQHLDRVLANVVSNGVKYGGKDLRITSHAEGDRVHLSVVDHGTGVPPDFVPRMFDRFTRSDTARGGHQRGSGLGLHIVQDLMVLNDGSVTYEPTPGGGATFVLDMPAGARA
ncbi:sensor histidine kinase [Nocardioides okcheonensis]|uniref:sensor histidine kinase n=1 Tax=Nocardioides okcheonensis TaxID=2894081 RepID=UPI001E38CB0F|nr:HAMP domain-containing sensor histidine kinase [Nocardioides okcheonensis]UFN45117.1 PAS domain S-box protein [Nocardioides okcheonensis]